MKKLTDCSARLASALFVKTKAPLLVTKQAESTRPPYKEMALFLCPLELMWSSFCRSIGARPGAAHSHLQGKLWFIPNLTSTGQF
jgi:hypothetical protein